jgi:hypothetical protein
MGKEIPYVRLTFNGGRYTGNTTPSPNDWEDDRECLKADPDLFDVDATKHDHMRAKGEYCDVCPVIKECRADRFLKRPTAAGIYAGMVWTSHAGEAPYDIDTYHETHKVGGKFRSDVKRPTRLPPDWTEERKCASEPIGCNEVFVVTSRNSTKIFHSTACRRRFKAMMGSSLADAG